MPMGLLQPSAHTIELGAPACPTLHWQTQDLQLLIELPLQERTWLKRQTGTVSFMERSVCPSSYERPRLFYRNQDRTLQSISASFPFAELETRAKKSQG